jgi:hypothetical protein
MRIYSEDNLGRFEAMASLLAWVAVGWLATILVMDGAYLIGHGVSGLRSVIRPMILVGVLAWLLPSAVSWTGDFSELVRYDLSSIPKPLTIAVVLTGVALGAVSIAAYQIYLLAYFQTLGLPWAAMAGHIGSMAVIVSIAIAYSGAAAWFVIFPRKSDWGS